VTARQRFARLRRRALIGVAAVAAGLGGVEWLLVAPSEPGSVRLFEVSLGWWAMLLGQVLWLAVLVFSRLRPTDRSR